jgi:phosphoribosylaminoimidazolecarboxamide formyltransferase / IMP cyclohydrolase
MAGLKAHPIHKTSLHIKRALISVSDKSGLEPLVKSLHAAGVQLISTGGTRKSIELMGVPVIDVSSITNFSECLDGRVKTLHPAVHAGLLARMDVADDLSEMAQLGYDPIQLVVVNLYPFEQTVTKLGVTLADALENIDIGGPTMIRAAAKNVGHVCVLTDPSQYPDFIDELEKGPISYEQRLKLSTQAFNRIAVYDTAIAGYLMAHNNVEPQPWLHLSLPLQQSLRYGENPHQPATVYGNQNEFIDCFHGKELSYNNYLDVDAALSLIGEFDDEEPVCAIIKHTVACGVGTGSTLLESYNRAFETDTVSPFGGIIIVNKELDLETAVAIDTIFTEIVIAPSYSAEAKDLLIKKANRRLITQLKPLSGQTRSIRSVFGGVLQQTPDLQLELPENWQIVTERKPSGIEMHDMIFAWKVVKHVKSNAIVFVRDGQTLGIGTGQTSRVDSAEIAVMKADKAGLNLHRSVVASDAFFPFADGVEAAAGAGATAVIQPGGSVRDAEVIDAANRMNLTMVFTGLRHFKH